MLSDPSDIIRELITLRKRISEITLRVRRAVDLLTDAYQELGDLVAAAVAAQPWRASSAARVAPATATAASSSQSNRPVDAIDPPWRRVHEDRPGPVTIWRMMKDGKFPQPRRLSTHAVARLEADVNEWVRARAP